MPRKRQQPETPAATGDDQQDVSGATATSVAAPPAEPPQKRKRSKAVSQEALPSETQPEPVAATPVEPPAATPAVPTRVAQEPPFEPTGSYTPTAPIMPLEEGPRGQFRSWVSDTSRGYSRLTDEEHQRLILQFTEKPPTEVLAALKEGGFRFQPDYLGQRNAWVRPDNLAGRIQAEQIEKLHRSLIPGTDSPSR